MESRRKFLQAVGVAGTLGVAGVGTASARRPGDTITELAVATPKFSILVAALQRADAEAGTNLVAALDGNRQFTVFAPNDQAFVDLLDSNPAWNGLGDIPIETLVSVLTYHVAPGRRDAVSVTSDDELPTLNRAKIAVDGTVLNGGQADIVGADFAFASNGIIHEINGVLLP